jgi:hypothetical protein
VTDRIICGYKPAPLGSNPARWPRGTTIRYRVALTGLPGIDRDLFRRVFRSACDSWQSVCGIEFAEVESRESLTVTTMSQQPGGVLADAELPYLQGRTTPLQMRFDAREPWAVGQPIPANRIGLQVVAEHELGHVLGLDHGGTDLMRPVYDPRMTIGQWERGLTVEAYGPPQPKTPTPVDPAADAELFRLITRAGGLVLQVREGLSVERMK